MRIYQFRKEEWDQTGTDGWLLVNAPKTYNPASGLGVAHDIMEHAINDNGTIEHELMAFGGVFYIRGEGGYFNNKWNSDPGWHISGDYSNLFWEYRGCDGIPSPGRTVRCAKHVEEWIDNSFQHGMKELELEFNGAEFKSAAENFFFNARGWVRKGYRRAEKRYAGVPCFRLNDLFKKIEAEADRLLHIAEDFHKLVVRFDAKRADAHIFLDENIFYEEDT